MSHKLVVRKAGRGLTTRPLRVVVTGGEVHVSCLLCMFCTEGTDGLAGVFCTGAAGGES